MWLIALKAIGGNVLVAVSAFGFGTWLSRFLPDSFSRFTRLVCTTIGGFGLLGLLLFIVGQVSFHRTTIGIVLATGVTSAVASKPWLWEFGIRIHKIPAAIVAAVLLLTAFGGLAEPVGDWGIDGVAYHYVGPKVWLREGIIRPIPDNAPTSYPSLVEVVFGALRAFGGERAPVFSAVWTLAFFLAVAVVLGLRCGLSTRGAWWAAALTATMGALYQGSHSGFVDAVYAAFILAGIRTSDTRTGLKKLEGAEFEQAKMEAIFDSDVRLKEVFPDMKVTGRAKVGDRDTYTVLAHEPGGKTDTFYFDAQTGQRIAVDSEGPDESGKVVKANIFLEDFRPIDGIQMPFRIRIESPAANLVITLQEVHHNVPIEDSIFAMPSSEPAATATH